ncbi:MAG TPA: D-alanyl-D-alanine carboxypeptidase/D-alanyl-D-alanine-endopeptidase [Solirubrobacteraceae bacterium]|nr:D-alanyl-D-alanine carboxypeptidase/D-alanyl-D-alanine-endopeptidase [Solirubrobacteraceae bacterium]
MSDPPHHRGSLGVLYPRVRRHLLAIVLGPAVLAAGPAGAQAYDGDDLRAKLSREMRLAGASSGALVRDLESGVTLYERRADGRRVPASVEKLFTTSTVLLRLGSGGTLATRVMTDGTLGLDGVLRGDVYLVGGGDPTLTGGHLKRLAQRLTIQGVQAIEGRVHGDESLFDGRRGGPRTRFGFDGYMGGVLSAVAYRRGFSDRLSPPVDAADRFAAYLRLAGIAVPAGGRAGVAPPDAQEIARVASPTMRDMAAMVNGASDNFAAEMLFKALGARFGSGGTHAAGQRVVRDEMRGLGLTPSISDGSGLSRANRTTPRQVVRLFEQMAERPDEGMALRASLPVAGRSGTLTRRMRGTPAERSCRAKTGTLNGVSSLAGMCMTRAGDDVAFAFLLNGVNTTSAKRIEDRMAAAIARVDEEL